MTTLDITSDHTNGSDTCRLVGRHLARPLTREEIERVSGGAEGIHCPCTTQFPGGEIAIDDEDA